MLRASNGDSASSSLAIGQIREIQVLGLHPRTWALAPGGPEAALCTALLLVGLYRCTPQNNEAVPEGCCGPKHTLCPVMQLLGL